MREKTVGCVALLDMISAFVSSFQAAERSAVFSAKSASVAAVQPSNGFSEA